MGTYNPVSAITDIQLALFSGFISQVGTFCVRAFLSSKPLQNTNWRWTYRVQIIWVFLELAALILVSHRQMFAIPSWLQLVPETYAPVLLQAKAQRQASLST